MSKLKSHAYADLFPLMTADELQALSDDIAENGLRQPIVRYGGAILDGRNRLLACERANVEPTFTDFDGDDAAALALVISLNAQRRDLTAAQRAIVAARALPMFEATKINGRPKKNGASSTHHSKSRDDASKVFKVGTKVIQQAKALLVEAPDLASQVESCCLSIAAAYETLQQRRAEAKQKQKDLERAAEFREQIDAGEISVEEALHRVNEAEREQHQVQASQADSRRTTLKTIVEFVQWIERFATDRTDEHLSWFGQPDAPGMFDHGLTEKRVSAAAKQLQRLASNIFSGASDGKKSR